MPAFKSLPVIADPEGDSEVDSEVDQASDGEGARDPEPQNVANQPAAVGAAVVQVQDLPRAHWHELLQEVRALGAGTFGSVCLMHDPVKKADFAVKKILKTRLDGRRDIQASLCREIGLLQRLRHTHVLRLHRAGQTDDAIVLQMNFAGRYNLYRVQKAQDDVRFIPSDAQLILEQLAHALDYCHGMGVVHRDLKHENIAVTKTAEGDAIFTLVDFGSAHEIAAPCEHVGTVSFMAPEVLALDAMGFDARKADVWSLGILLLEMLCGLNFLPNLFGWAKRASPSDPSLPADIRRFLSKQGSLTHAMEQQLPVSNSLNLLMNSMLCLSIPHRWTAAWVTAAAWLQAEVAP